jgi:hypothetical protein
VSAKGSTAKSFKACILIDNAIDYTKRVEVERVAWHATVLDLLVLVVKVVEKSWSIVSTVRFCEKIEVLGSTDLRVELRNGVQESLQYVLHINCISYVRKLLENLLTKVAMAARSVVSIVPSLRGSRIGYLPVAGHSVEL